MSGVKSARVALNVGQFSGMIDALEAANPSASRYSLIRDALEAGLKAATAGMEIGPSRTGGHSKKTVRVNVEPADSMPQRPSKMRTLYEGENIGQERAVDVRRIDKHEPETLTAYLEREEARLAALENHQRKSDFDVNKVAWKRSQAEKGESNG